MPSAACCPCGQLVGCTCTGINCGTICERRAGIAEMCGFPEFADPSNPPKFYHRRRTTGGMTTSRFGSPTCGAAVPVPASTECRSKTGTGTLIGLSEFPVAPFSSPPKKYRRLTSSGSDYFCPDGGCGGASNDPGRHEYEDGYQYDAATGLLTITGIQRNFSYPGGGGCALNPAGTVPFDPPSGAYHWVPSLGALAPYVTDTVTPNQRNWDHVGCIGTGPFAVYRWDVAVQAILEDEDTEDDAVARFRNAGAWSGAGLCSSQISSRAVRTSGFSFAVTVVQTRGVVSSGLSAGVSYNMRLKVGRRPAGTSGPFVDYGSDIVVPFTASGPAFTSDWQDLPNDSDFEYQAIGIEVLGGVSELVADSWDVDEDFGPNLPAGCSPVLTDNSQRTVNGTPVAWPFDLETPPDAYGGQAIVSAMPDERQTVGNDTCGFNVTSGYYERVTGTVTESLSDEDTDEDAMDRALGSAPWVACVPACASVGCTAFITQRGPEDTTFAFAEVRTKATFPATIGVSYLVTIRFAARVLGTSGPFLFYGLTEVVVTADAISEETDWQEVPREPGLEIIVANCSVVALP